MKESLANVWFATVAVLGMLVVLFITLLYFFGSLIFLIIAALDLLRSGPGKLVGINK
jgi:hypothetical protein